MIDTKISDLKETKKELRKHLLRRQHELRCYLNAYVDLLTDEELLSENVLQSLQSWTERAAENRLAEVKTLKKVLEKIDEQIKKEEGEE